jgi:predicted nucleic-acid-binding protein
MVGLDTNVLVRYLAQDEPRQSERATRFLEQELDERRPGYISLVVLVETCWVLKRLYRATNAELQSAVRDLLDVRQLAIEQRAVVASALARLEDQGGELADALIVELARSAGCHSVVSFDKRATRLGMSLLQ